jgi:glycerophosphoryl diester phosphodiesterase
MKKSIFIIFLFLMNATYVSQLFAQYNLNENTMVVGHRGASRYAPENTVASAKLAWDQQAEAVEIDVHLSSDNQIVVIHDYDTKKTCGQKHIVSQTPLHILKELDAGSWKDEKYKGEQIPTLSEIVTIIPEGRKLVVEIKSDIKIVPVIEKNFSNHPKVDQLIFIAFDYETILAAKKAFPNNKAFWLSSKFPDGIKSTLEKVKADGLDGVDLHYSIVTLEVMKIADGLGLEVHVWTVNDLEKAKELKKIGISSITTDIPDEVVKVLAMK